MREIPRGLLTLAFCATLMPALVSSATAGTYATSLVYGSDDVTVRCFITNVGTTPVSFAVAMFDTASNPVAATSSCGNCCDAFGGTLPAGASCQVYDPGVGTYRGCTFEASSSKIRAALVTTLNDSPNPTLLSFPATEK